jgi:hypothetical protein
MSDARGFLVAVNTGKASDPASVGLDDCQPLADLLFADVNARRLPVEIRAERNAVDFAPENLLQQRKLVGT